MHDGLRDNMLRLLDESLHEFDRLMTKTIDEIGNHASLQRDYEVLQAKQRMARLAGASFVGEAAMALADLRKEAA